MTQPVPQTARPPLMLLNGQPVYPGPDSQEVVTAENLLALATFVTDQPEVALAWMDRSNPGLRNLTPRQAVERGQGQDAANILRAFMAL